MDWICLIVFSLELIVKVSKQGRPRGLGRQESQARQARVPRAAAIVHSSVGEGGGLKFLKFKKIFL